MTFGLVGEQILTDTAIHDVYHTSLHSDTICPVRIQMWSIHQAQQVEKQQRDGSPTANFSEREGTTSTDIGPVET